MAKTLQALTACNETKAAYLFVSLPPSMDNIVDNLQTKETIVYEDVRAKLLDLSANRTVAGNSKTAYRVQKPSDAPKGSGPGREEKDCNWCRKRKMRSQGHTWNECRKLKAHNAKQKEEKVQQVSPETKPEDSSNFATAFMISSSPTPSNPAPVQPSPPVVELFSGVGDIWLKCRRRSGGIGYAILRDVVLDEGLEENLFSYLSVMGKGFKLQGEGDDVWCVILYFYPATCGPKGHGSGSAAA